MLHEGGQPRGADGELRGARIGQPRGADGELRGPRIGQSRGADGELRGAEIEAGSSPSFAHGAGTGMFGGEDSCEEDEGIDDQDLWGRIRHEADVEELRNQAPANRAAAVEEAVRQLRLAADGGPGWIVRGETLVELAVGKDLEVDGNLWQALIFLLEEERSRLERYAHWLDECCEEWLQGSSEE